MNIIIPTKKLNYLKKKYGNVQAIVQQVFDNWFISQIDIDYEKKKVKKIDIDKKIDELTKSK